MIEVSIDMSINDDNAQNRIFGKVIDIQNDTLLCEFTNANYDFDNQKKIRQLQTKLEKAEDTIKLLKKAVGK